MFTANVTYTFDDYLSVNEYHSKHAGKKRHICCIILGLIMIGLGVWCIRKDILELWFQIIVIAFGLYSVFHVYVTAFFMYRASKKKKLALHYEFGDEMFTVTSGKTESSTYYKAVDILDLENDTVYLYINKLGFHFIPLKDIYGGTRDEFCAFLSEKTGKEIGKA